MSHKPLIAKRKYRLNRRLIIFSLIFVFFTFITALLHQISMWNALPQYTPLPNWLFYPLVFSFFIAFLDMVLWFGLLLILEFVGIIAVVYTFSFTRLYSFNYIWKQFGNNTLTAVFSAILLIIDVIGYFELYSYIPHRKERYNDYWSKDYTKEEQEPQGEPEQRAEEKVSHTKEELGRLINLWQQKYASATTDEERKMANEMILKYQAELEKLKAKNGATPERAKLTQGGDKK